MTLDHPADPTPTDWRGQPQCGDVIIQAAPDGDPDTWRGTVLDPRNGHVWRAIVTLRSGNLHLHGYFAIPLFGETEDWAAYSGHIDNKCHFTLPGSP